MSTFPRNPIQLVASERGSSLVFTILGMVVLLGMVALSVDLGMLLGSRTDSQRAADGAALAGAASLISEPDNDVRPKEWAEEYAELNTVLGNNVELEPELDVEVLLAEQKVRVRVRNITERGNAIRTVFARILGWSEMDVGTVAAAEVVDAGSTVCPFPATIADRWLDNPSGPNAYDALFNPADGDKYEPHYDLADGDAAVAKDEGDQCAYGSFGSCGATPNHVSYPGPEFTGFVGGANLGMVFELKTKANKNQDPPGPTDPLLPGGGEPHAVSPCVLASAWRCWWDPTGGGGGANELNYWVNGCPDGAQDVVVGAGDWIEPKNGQTQSVVKTAKKLIDEYGGDDWDFDPDKGCMSNIDGCMDPTTPAFDKRHRAVPIIDPSATLSNNDPMLVMRWECIFLEKVADSYYLSDGVTPSPNGQGPSGQWNLYVRFARGCSGLDAQLETQQTVKTLRLVE